MSASHSPPQRLDPGTALDRLDAQLGEIGRREHRFTWLRDASAEDWIVVDAYYPGNQVVVLASDDTGTIAACEDLVPANGLILLTLRSADLRADGPTAEALRARLEIQGWQRRAERPTGRSRPQPERPPPGERRQQAERQPQAERRPQSSPRARAARGRSRGSESEGMGIGIVLVLAVGLELFVGGALIGLDAGQYVLGFGFMLDACARVLGLVVASQAGDLDAAWAAVIFGALASWNLKDAEASDLVPVARLTAGLTGAAVALGLIIWII